jgi:hypothetical protein
LPRHIGGLLAPSRDAVAERVIAGAREKREASYRIQPR